MDELIQKYGKDFKSFSNMLERIGLVLGVLDFLMIAVILRNILGLLAGLVSGGVVFLSFWISAWVLHGLGTLIESSEEQTRYLRQLIASDKERAREKEGDAFKKTPAEEAAAKGTAENTSVDKAEEKPFAEKKVSREGYIRCSNCGQEQKANRTVCYRCGAKFEKEIQ